MGRSELDFRITGFLGRLPVTATWKNGYLTADEELLEVAQELVDRGCGFEGPDGRSLRATLKEPLAALLTIIRSFGRITKATINLPLDHPTTLQRGAFQEMASDEAS